MILYEAGMVLGGIWLQFRHIGLYWAGGLIAGSLVSVYLSENISQKMAALSGGGNKVFFLTIALSIASILGIASPLCMYGTVPIIAALGKKGVPQHILTAFMVSSILLNPNIFLFTFALGTDLALIRLGLSFLSGLLAGFLAMVFFRKKDIFSFDKFETKEEGRKKTFFRDLFKAFRITFPYLLFGITLSSIFERYVPPDFIVGFFGQRQGLGVLFAASISIPLYVCGGGTIPLIRAWLFAGMGQGEAMAFMLAGPAVKINNLSAVKMILGKKNFVLYIVYCLSFAIISAWIMEIILG